VTLLRAVSSVQYELVFPVTVLNYEGRNTRGSAKLEEAKAVVQRSTAFRLEQQDVEL